MDSEAYLEHIVQADERAVESLDKATISLSGGGLGISLAFLNDIAAQPVLALWSLITSWIAWTLSVVIVLGSLHSGHLAMRRWMIQSEEERIAEKPGGWWSTLTDKLNIAGFLFFITGAGFMAAFAIINLEGG